MDPIMYHEAIETDTPQILVVIKAAFSVYEGWVDPPSSAERKMVDIV